MGASFWCMTVAIRTFIFNPIKSFKRSRVETADKQANCSACTPSHTSADSAVRSPAVKEKDVSEEISAVLTLKMSLNDPNCPGSLQQTN